MKRTLSIALVFCMLICVLPMAASAAELPIITEQPQGAECEIGTPFTMHIGATSPDGGTLSYQWYWTSVNDISTIKAIYDVNDHSVGVGASYVPDPEIGTTYYCCMITNTLSDGTESFVYSNLVPVTFRAKMFNLFALKDLTPPAVGEKPDTTVTRVAKDADNFYGYDVIKVSWSPNDATFKAGVAYTVKIRCKVWDNASVRSDYFGTVNGAIATMPYEFDPGGEITVSYTFPALPEADVAKPVITKEPADIEVPLGEKAVLEASVTAPEDSAQLLYLWYTSKTGEGDVLTQDGDETGKWTALKDCKESSMKPDTSEVGEAYYKLVVINEDEDGNTNFTESRAAKVTVVSADDEQGGTNNTAIIIIALAVVIAAALVILLTRKNKNK